MLDPDRPYAFLSEQEPLWDVGGGIANASVATVFLTASRCPVGCSMCDLHQNTLATATPPGAIVRQIGYAQDRLPPSQWIKLYNSGNFFDPQSIPPADHDAIAARCEHYSRVIVENHPRFGTAQHRRVRDLFAGKLEIAVGLETVQPRWLQRLGKRMTRDDFDRYAKRLHDWGIDLRVFLMVGVPGATLGEAIRWTRLSVRHAIAAGARHISLIPARAGNGWDGRAGELPAIRVQDLAELFAAALEDARPPVCVSVDVWDLANADLCDHERGLTNRLQDAVLNQDASVLHESTL